MRLGKTARELGLETDEYAALIEMFLDTARTDLEKLHSAVHLNDAPAASKAAHSIKGAAGNLRLNPVFTIARRCEQEAGENAMEQVLKSVSELQAQLDSLAQQIAE